MKRLNVLALACLVLAAGVAQAELTVSVTITGPVEEILPLLQHLKTMGLTGASGGGASAPLTLMSTSVPTQPPADAAPAPAAPPEPPKPSISVVNPKAEPATLVPGGTVAITAQVLDPEHKIDTIAATVEGLPGTTDLFDNGTHGDATAGDDLWSGTLTCPQGKDAPEPGEKVVTLRAFGADGAQVTIPGLDGKPVPVGNATKLVVSPEPAATK